MASSKDSSGKPVLFSEWLRSKMEAGGVVGHVAKAWNALDPSLRKGRINAARLDRVLGGNSGAVVVAKYTEDTGRTP